MAPHFYERNMKTAAQHWDEWQQQRTPGRFTDWGDHPLAFAQICENAFGDGDCDFIEYIRRCLPDLSQAHVLSLCCGDGAFEHSLLQKGVFGQVTGFDLSAERVNAGNAVFESAHGDACAQKIHLECKDVNTASYGTAKYDIVFAKSALHHIENLEHAFEQIARCLKPGGKLVTIDFFGPTRFQWTQEQLKVRSWFWRNHVPEDLRKDRDGNDIPEIGRPTVQAMIAMDPSEAVRSGELYALLKQYFAPSQDIALGGSLVNLLLYGAIVNNFDPAIEKHNAVIRDAFSLERLLMDLGVLGSDFRLIIAEPLARPTPPPGLSKRLAKLWSAGAK
ncbi:MAG: hypothetical protein B7X79_14145 [Acidovorax sp. 17-64-282]|jgi:SAM-dependent methyltransferase|nr:MAG: hypothetical protein B7Y64_10760 [Acidovorax sp. 35-64-16]OYY84925.1 MAG: hypothetical protein B7Y46_11160 [Acidovorax sp. 28-64-14]OYZ43114.1 MAG: hypothetical protein B7Y20_15710 [Acidovorax sp. 16-64-162]OYZ71068.1 MAG: hypothetical protein B7Y14_02010 [Acidovorax sp. 24-64-9]OZA55630.1 MAG: hypothetical protein B7X79_14145 [Acidovorax sp. 17-64-282]OZA69514.1 MAG: hypothetical protein B7X70_10765 [Acidovorax sp. 39-64-12]